MPSSLYQPLHFDWPQGVDQGNNTINYRFWLPYAWRLDALQAYIQTVNTQGTCSLTATESSGGSTVLTGASFDLNTLVASTVTSLGLASGSVLDFNANEILTLSVASNNALYNGSGLFWLLGAVGR